MNLLLFLLLTAAAAAAAAAQDSDPELDCTNRWIHIRQLPPQFNLHLLSNCSAYPVFDNFCPYTANHGLGRKTHSSSRSWYRTDASMLELIFHRRMLEYPCLTADPNLAAAIYLPYYAALDALKYLYGPDQNSSFLHGQDLFYFLITDRPWIWHRRRGHDHFLVMARPAWDFSQPLSNDPPIFGTSFLESPEFFNVTALTLEARAYPWQEQAIPYPTSFHPQNLRFLESWINRVRKSKRSTLMMFAGGGGISSNPNVRRSIRLECDNATTVTTNGTGYDKLCDFVDCSNGICEHDPIRFIELLPAASWRHSDAAVVVRRNNRRLHPGVLRGAVGEAAVRMAHGGGGIRAIRGVHSEGGGGGEGDEDHRCVDEDSEGRSEEDEGKSGGDDRESDVQKAWKFVGIAEQKRCV